MGKNPTFNSHLLVCTTHSLIQIHLKPFPQNVLHVQKSKCFKSSRKISALTSGKIRGGGNYRLIRATSQNSVFRNVEVRFNDI